MDRKYFGSFTPPTMGLRLTTSFRRAETYDVEPALKVPSLFVLFLAYILTVHTKFT